MCLRTRAGGRAEYAACRRSDNSLKRWYACAEFNVGIGNVLLEKCNNSVQNEVKRNLYFV